MFEIFNIGRPNKKVSLKRASLNLSINAIVIIVLAMTLLGLGLGFIKGMMGKLIDLTETTFEKTSENLNRDLTTSTEPLVFSKSKYTMPRGSTSLEGFGVRNDGNLPLTFGIKVETFSCPADARDTDDNCDTEIVKWFDYFNGDNEYNVPAAEIKTAKVQITIPNAKTGLYLFKFMAYEGSWPAAGTSKDCIGDYDRDTDTGCTIFGETEFFLTIG